MTTSVETTSSSSLNSFSSISNLERQYASPLGQRLLIGLQVNAACCLEGGVEAILKLKGKTDPLSNEAAVAPTAAAAAAASFEETAGDDFDAFAFLNESEANKTDGAQQPMDGKKKGIGVFFKKMAANTTAHLERQMQGLAVKLDKGRNSDLFRVAMYDPVSQALLGVTDSIPVPSERQDCRFEIPLVSQGGNQQVLLKLWIQSGAALLQSAKVAKNYLLGSVTVDCSKLLPGQVSTVPLTSNLVVGGQLQVCAWADPKFSQILMRGWSLTDPDISAYSSNLNYLPLDQSYVLQGKQAQHWLVATERTTESTTVLPIAAAVMELAAKASRKSLNHASCVAKRLRIHRHDFKDPTKATCNVGIVGVSANSATTPVGATISASWRRPDSMFELELVANEKINIVTKDMAAGFPSINLKLYPKLTTEGILPGIMQAMGGQMPTSGFLLGALYFCVTVQCNDQIELWESVVGMESFIDNVANTIQVPLVKNGQQMGHLFVQIQVTLPSQKEKYKEVDPTEGLVSLVGLENMAEGVKPVMDSDHEAGPNSGSLRDEQLTTMGYFFATQYMDQHLTLRQSAVESFEERARAYKQALLQPAESQAHQTRTPKSFRPSSSRSEALLSGIAFNVHNAALNISVVDAMRTPSGPHELPGAAFHNITHGAPSDHARGFGNVLQGISNVNASGGLRRLEAKRWECAQALQRAQNLLIAGVGNYLATARKSGQVNHIPSRHAEIQGLRWKVFEAVHNLHHITWMCSVRRANCFSQALGLAVSSYLASISDVSKCATGWPEVWKRHGYLTCFEGLLSAAGKELGMIEDASVSIAMLRMVRIVFMPDSGIPSRAVHVPSSPYLRWANLFASGQGAGRHYLLQIGVDPQYYQERIPKALQNNTAVQLYPLLYEVGVDIRQFGAHAGNNLMKQSGKTEKQEVILMEEEDDEEGGPAVVDSDVLVALNFEALKKMNAYAHAINPQDVLLNKVQAAMNQVFAPQYGNNTQQDQHLLPVHPSMSLLHSHIMSSSGKMNHSILDEAAVLAQQLGGGGLVFCKSGKDRTAMHVTYKQAQFAARYRDEHNQETILRDANLMRLHGTRLPICEKNVGESKYAFNALQVKFMPEALKPPLNTLAGFKLKIES